MNNSHWLLLIFWTGYCILHSLMAGNKLKANLQKLAGPAFKYYRLLYSVFAATALAFLLWFHFSISSPKLFDSRILMLPGIITGATGLGIMIACINKYFYELSGLQAIKEPVIRNTLQQSGLHKYVRHPLYLGTLLFIWGLFFIFPLMSNLVAATIITIYVLLGIRIEERKLHLEYGELYGKYVKKVPKLFPNIYTAKKGSV